MTWSRDKKKIDRTAKKTEESQSRLNRESAKLNYDYGEMSAEEADRRQREYYDYTSERESAAVKLQEWKDAGLSPGAFAGGSGGGGTGGTPAMGSGAGGQRGKGADAAAALEASNNAKLANAEVINKGAETALLMSEKKKAEAETANIAKDTEGKDTETELIRTQINDILQGIENKKAQQTGQTLQNEFDSLRNNTAGQLNNANLENTINQGRLLEQQIEEAQRNNQIGKETMNEVIGLAKQEFINAIAEGALKTSQTDKNYAEIQQNAERILQGWEGIDVAKRGVTVKEKSYELEELLKTLGVGVENIKKAKQWLGEGISGTGKKTQSNPYRETHSNWRENVKW